MCLFLSALWIPALRETLQLYVGQRGTACHRHPDQSSLCTERTFIPLLTPCHQYCSHQPLSLSSGSVTVVLCFSMISRLISYKISGLNGSAGMIDYSSVPDCYISTTTLWPSSISVLSSLLPASISTVKSLSTSNSARTFS